MRIPTTSRTIALTALLAAAGSAVAIDDTVAWRSHAAQRLDAPASSPATAARDALRIADASPRMVLRFDRALSKPERAALAQQGVTLLSPLGSGAYFARVDKNAQATTLTASGLIGAAPIRIEHKLHDALLENAPPAWSIVDGARDAGPLADPTVGVYVRFHDDVDAVLAEAHDVIANHAGVVRDTLNSVNAMVVELPLSQVRQLASDDRVQWIEPPLPRMEHYNASNRAITQVNAAQSAPYNLDGSGVTVLVYDGGTARATHNDLAGRTTVIDASGTNYHSTHVAGTVAGNGSANATHTGMAPGANIVTAGFEYDGSGTFLYTNPGDIEADYTTAIGMGANISNNSIGSNIGPNGFPCSYEGDYGLCAATIDNIVRGAAGGPIVIFWSAGNERGWSCGSSYNTSPPPTNNKNAITVGALNSNDDSMTSFSSWGPSDDGRVRPIIAGPGCQSNGDGGVTSCDDDNDSDYTTLCGTSMSGPTLAGMGALIFEDFRNTFPSQPDPSNQLMKTWLTHSAVDLGNAGPDYQYGYGSARVVDAIDLMRTGNWAEDIVDQGGNVSYTINVSAGAPELKATLAWDDPAGTPNVSPSLINDLDLVVISPTGVRHYPWTLNPASPASPAVRNQEDHLNNIEQVQVANPEPGPWRVEIRGTSVAQGPQTFALTATPDLGEGLLAAALNTAVPTLHPPATPLPVEMTVFEGIDSLVPNSVTISYRYDAGAFTTVPMNDDGADAYSFSLPGADCDETIEFFVSAEGAQAGVINIPSAGASNPFSVSIGEIAVLFDEDFETDSGWTVSGSITTQAAGRWERGVPVGGGDRGDPPADADGSGSCWLTGNADGNTDVDNGNTILTSSDFALAGAPEAVLSYRRWYDTTVGASSDDFFIVEISNNAGASWTTLESVGPNSTGAWNTFSFRVADYVTPTDQVRLRFTVSDNGTQNVIEAGVDAIHAETFLCEGPSGCSEADLAEPFGALDFSDVSAFLTAFALMDPSADLAAPFGVHDFSDISAYLTIFGAGCP